MEVRNIGFGAINSNAFRKGMILSCTTEHYPETHKLNSMVKVLNVSDKKESEYIDVTFRRGRKTDYKVFYPRNYMDHGLDLIGWVKETVKKATQKVKS